METEASEPAEAAADIFVEEELVYAAEVAETPAEPSDADILRGLQVLLVDDGREDAEAALRCLTTIGVRQVVWARTPKQIYRQFSETAEHLPDVVIVELDLTATSGLQLLARLRGNANPALQALPAIVVTNSKSASVQRRASSHRISAYVRKPFAAEDLRVALLRAKRGEILEPEAEPTRSWLDEPEPAAGAAPAPTPWWKRLLAFLFPPQPALAQAAAPRRRDVWG